MKHLTCLQTLNVTDNCLTSLRDLESPSLQNLSANGNPFTVLDFDPSKLPSLEEVKFGSKHSQFVSFSILESSVTDSLKLEVSDCGRQALIIPPPDTLENPKELDSYVTRRDITLEQICTMDPEMQYKSLLWLIENKNVEFESLDLAGQQAFYTHIGMEKLQIILSKVPEIVKLNVSNCELQTIPRNIENLPRLKQLYLQDNIIDKCDQIINTCVEEIHLEGNPILGVDFDHVSIPSLRILKVGSTETKYISLNLLQKAREGRLKIDVPNKYLTYLVFPNQSCVTTVNCLRTFVDNASLDLTTVPPSEKRDTFSWVLQHNGQLLESLRMPEIGEEQKNSEEGRRDLEDIISHFDMHKHQLVKLKHLYMSNTGLRSVPNVSMLNNLLTVDFSRN